LNFQQQKSLLNQYLPHSESKSYQMNSIKACSSRSFHEHQRHVPIPLKLSATIWYNFQWRNRSIFKNFMHHKPKRHGTKPVHPSSSRNFQRHQQHNLKHLSSVDLITTKQNKTNYLPSWIDSFPPPSKVLSKLKSILIPQSGKKCNSFTLSTDRLVSSMHI
jgi:hypothetical protein